MAENFCLVIRHWRKMDVRLPWEPFKVTNMAINGVGNQKLNLPLGGKPQFSTPTSLLLPAVLLQLIS